MSKNLNSIIQQDISNASNFNLQPNQLNSHSSMILSFYLFSLAKSCAKKYIPKFKGNCANNDFFDSLFGVQNHKITKDLIKYNSMQNSKFPALNYSDCNNANISGEESEFDNFFI